MADRTPDRTQHDIEEKHEPATGGSTPVVPNPQKIEQGSKNPDVRDPGDRADKPTPPR